MTIFHTEIDLISEEGHARSARKETNLGANQTLFMIARWMIQRLWSFSCAFTLPSFEGHDLEGLVGDDLIWEIVVELNGYQHAGCL